MIREYQRISSCRFSGICNVPDRPGKRNKFRNIIDYIIQHTEIEDLSSRFVCVRDYPDNKSLSAADRAENIRDAFHYSGELNGRTVALIDDIITTGASVTACVEELLHAGAEDVVVFVLGINQFGCNHWTGVFKTLEDYSLRFNAENLVPFFSQHNSRTTLSYEPFLGNLMRNINEELLSFDDSDDGMSSFF